MNRLAKKKTKSHDCESTALVPCRGKRKEIINDSPILLEGETYYPSQPKNAWGGNVRKEKEEKKRQTDVLRKAAEFDNFDKGRKLTSIKDA